MSVGKDMLLLLLCHLLLLQLAHSKCQKSFTCRNFSLQFPFTSIRDSECGLFAVDGCDSSSTEEHPLLHIGDSPSPKYILQQTSENKFLILDFLLQTLLESRNSCFTFMNVSLPQSQSPSVSFTISPNITFFTCFNKSRSRQIQDYFQNYRREVCEASTLYYKITATHDHAPPPPTPLECSVTQLPIKSDGNSSDLLNLLTFTYILEWNVSEDCSQCYSGGGQCLAENENEFYCKTGNTTFKRIALIGGIITAALTSALIIISVFIWRKRTKAKHEHEKEIQLFLKQNGNLAPMRYKYSNLKKMTNSFSEKLGRGGFGSVYKGQFPDDHLVAVKVLNESNENGEDFMNEIASISRTSHLNIVELLGFCFEGSKRALIYDFMPNGSLEKFICNNASSYELGWEKLFEIALGIARGLEYLHQGCNTRIFHLDIKPQNILLDKDLNPKIADFGLARMCPNRSSVVSMSVARGTIGYIAPEVFSRNFGEVSYKADVYSYGMLVLEMVGGRKNIDHTSEVYFPHHIYKQLEMNAEREGNISGTMNEEDESQAVKRNLIMVGLWCIQTNPNDRPSMAKVVEMLEGKLGSLEFPPKPYLFSPPQFSTYESL